MVFWLVASLLFFRQPVRRCRTPRSKRHDQSLLALHGHHDVQIDALVKRQEPSGEEPDMHPAPLCVLSRDGNKTKACVLMVFTPVHLHKANVFAMKTLFL